MVSEIDTLGIQGGGLSDPTSVGEGNETFLIRVWKPLPSRRVLKTMRLTMICKGQSEQYLQAVDLGCYINTKI